jgi:hypothetical protein
MEQPGTQGPVSTAPGPGPQTGGPGQMPPTGPGRVPPTGPGGEWPPGRGPRHSYRYRSLFWPLILIAAGVIWLLYSLGVISGSNLAILELVWPVFVIGIGVDLLVGHRSPAAGAIVGVVTIAIVVVLMAVGPGLGWGGTTELKTETFSTPVGEATQAQVEIGLSGNASSIHALPSATATDRPLIYATVTHRGTIEFTAKGTTDKKVTLTSASDWQWWQHLGGGGETPWDVGLDGNLPLTVVVRASSGSSTLDLSGLQLRALEMHASSGDSQISLPAAVPQSAFRPDIQLDSSSGRMDVQAPDAAAFGMSVQMSSGDTRVSLGNDASGDISFRGSSGSFSLTVRSSQALRVEVKNISSGSVALPDTLTRVSGEGKKGVWQTAGYDSAAYRVALVIESMSSGSVKIQMEG